MHIFQSGLAGEGNCYCIGCSTNSLSLSCTYSDNESIVSCIKLGNIIQFKHHYRKVRPLYVIVVYLEASLLDRVCLQ